MVTQFHLHFLLNGLPDFIWFEAPEETQQRLRRILQHDAENRKPFFCFDTVDGFAVAVATSAIQIANCLWDFAPDSDRLAQQFWKKLGQEESRMDIQVYLRGRDKPLELYSSDPVILRLVLDALDIAMGAENPFISFQDEDDETVFIQSAQLILLVAPQSALATHDERFNQIEE